MKRLLQWKRLNFLFDSWMRQFRFNLDRRLIFFYYFPQSSHFENGRRSGVESEVMTVRELADYLKLAEKTAYRLAADGKIPGFKVGASWRFRRSEIDRWIAAQEQGRG